MKKGILGTLAMGLLTAACGGEKEFCTSGQSEPCTCADGQQGFANCREDGLAFGECDCDSCQPRASKHCAIDTWFWVDSCGNVADEAGGLCICACKPDGTDCSDWQDPLVDVLAAPCTDRGDCLKKTVWDCEVYQDQWVWGSGYFPSCFEDIRCYFQSHSQAKIDGNWQLFEECMVPTEMNKTLLGFSSTRRFDSQAECLADQESYLKPEIISERWVCVLASEPQSCLPFQQSGEDLCQSISPRCPRKI